MIQLLAINDRQFYPGPATIDGYEFEISVAETPLQAFNKIIHLSPDAIILNMECKDMDGATILHRIRNMQASKNVPVLMLAAESMASSVSSLVEPGKTEFLPIPTEMKMCLRWAANILQASAPEEQESIMVIDDDPAVLDIVNLFLGARYRVIAISSAKLALVKLKMMIPDLILLDIDMPGGMNGIELFKAIREVDGCQNIPILFETGMAGVRTVRQCVRLGAAGFVMKPIQKNILRERIEECLNPEKFKKKKIYVFEEYDFMYSMFHSLLKDDFEVVRGAGIMQSLNSIGELKPDYILFNIDSAAFALPRIHEKADSLHVPIILLTKDFTSELAQKEHRKLNTYLVQLPTNRDTLVGTINGIGPWIETPDPNAPIPNPYAKR